MQILRNPVNPVVTYPTNYRSAVTPGQSGKWFDQYHNCGREAMTKSRDDRDDQKQTAHDPGRRRFLKGMGIAGAGAAIADRLWTEAEAEEKEATPETLSGNVKVVLDVNGQKREAQVEPRTTLLNTLRNHLDPAVTGPKLVCDVGTCGACTVLLDGKPVYSCLVLAVDATKKKITTVEGLGTPENPNAVQAAFVENDALMCGFCTPGFVTTISAYLKKNPNPTMDQVREACKGNFCRCGSYPRVFVANMVAAKGLTSSLCNLCVLCASVLNHANAYDNHLGTENTEVEQRNPRKKSCNNSHKHNLLPNRKRRSVCHESLTASSRWLRLKSTKMPDQAGGQMISTRYSITA